MVEFYYALDNDVIISYGENLEGEIISENSEYPYHHVRLDENMKEEELLLPKRPSLKKPEIPEKLKNVRRNVGDCDFECPNCGKKFHRTLWEMASEWERDLSTNKWKITWGSGPVTAFVDCPCGAEILVAETDYEGTVELFHIRQNGKEVKV